MIELLIIVDSHVNFQTLINAKDFPTAGVRTMIRLRSKVKMHVCFESDAAGVSFVTAFNFALEFS